ncbi:MAG TPA: acyl-CoA dehydrogenase family protein [Tepidisphaeraceae bacterium]|nr:acyl-CoA dehydrogenase family protein [Tepidisphaeraceae bacterium]
MAPDLKALKGVSQQDRRLIEQAEQLLGPEPQSMGFVKNLFWGRVRQELIFPYPQQDPDEKARCQRMLADLDDYLRNEHPAVQIDQEQQIPRWCIDRLFQIGVLGMTIPREYGGGGLGITSYNRILERIGRSCGSTAVMVSAHQSIGCKAIMLFGTEEQKRRWLPMLATHQLSAFCLSEPNVGCDAGGQETRCELSPDGQYYILNGEKKWATSGAISALFTVMARQKMADGKERVTALVCTPDMPGVEIYQANRSKCGIRGTWQARIRFRDVKVPRSHLLHQEGKGLNVALSCLNYGRCTLSAGMLGAARRAFEQATKWAQTRYQFQRPLAEFELVQQKIARMSALCYAMDAMLYLTTAMLDRHDEDIMVETAICKTFCSEMGWRVVNDAMQIMGGEGYMAENEIERILRDSRINLIVEGANEVMQSFIFAYGGKQLAEHMLGVRESIGQVYRRPSLLKVAIPLAAELYLGIKPRPPRVSKVDPSLQPVARRFARLVRDLSHHFKLASKHYGEAIVRRQAVQARIADAAMWLHAFACTLSKLDRNPHDQAERDVAMHLFDLAEHEIRRNFREIFQHTDESMQSAAKSAMAQVAQLPNSDYVIPEASPVARGTGRKPPQDGIKQFPGPTPSRHAQPQASFTPPSCAQEAGAFSASGCTQGEGRGEGSVGRHKDEHPGQRTESERFTPPPSALCPVNEKPGAKAG